ncbi:MAG: hypothetical protein IJD35_07590, partial [Clostridia bacterium]|nr:hypothetical protein [Clostridia bacterium]
MKKRILLLPLFVLLLFALVFTVSCDNSDSNPTTKTTNTNITSQNAPSSTAASTETPKTTVSSSKDTISTTPAPSSSSKPKETTSTPNITETPGTTKPSEPEIPEPQYGTKIRVKYAINNSHAGSLEGKTTQDVYYGKTTTEAVSVTANLGYKFVGWSDGAASTVRSNECPKENTTYTAIFEFDTKELPILDLRTNNGQDVNSKEVYVSGKISIHNGPEGFNFEDFPMEIRGRGNYTW